VSIALGDDRMGVGYLRVFLHQVHDEPALPGDTVAKLLQSAVRQNAAVSDDHHAGAQGLDVVHVVGREDDGNAALAVEPPDEVSERQLGHCVEANGRLVQKQDRRCVKQGRGKVASHSLTQAKLSHGHVQEGLQIQDFDELVTSLGVVDPRDPVDVVSPHYYYPTDRGWQFGGTVENMMHEIHMFDRAGALSLDNFSGSGADWLERYKPLINDGETVVASPHKVYGPENNDLVLQLRKRGVSKVILAGMSANLCVEAHLREFLEQGFDVTVAKDATAGARHPDLGDGYQAALVNFGYLASAVVTTDEVVEALG
jgi:hypothetical protein